MPPNINLIHGGSHLKAGGALARGSGAAPDEAQRQRRRRRVAQATARRDGI